MKRQTIGVVSYRYDRVMMLNMDRMRFRRIKIKHGPIEPDL